MTNSPAKPILALSIGIIGHRPNRLPDHARKVVESQVDDILAHLKASMAQAKSTYRSFLADHPARLTMISALAEGADRIAAQAALKNGLDLTSVLPFPVADYENDFVEAASREEYANLLARSAKTLVLPGDYHSEHRDYEPVGRVILDNADVILAVWDGGPSGGRGGTTELLQRAAEKSLPIIHIDATGQSPPRLLWAELALHPVSGMPLTDMPAAPASEAIGDLVDRIVRPPNEPAERAGLSRFLGERLDRFNWRVEVPLMLALFGLRKLRRADFLPPPPDTGRDRLNDILPAAAAPNAADPNAGPLRSIGDTYGAADALAIRQAQGFRGGYVAIFVFSALAVIIAALALVGQQLFGWDTWTLAALQLVLVALVLVYTQVGLKRDWHGRWREAREVAERLRAAIPLWLLGTARPDASGAEPTWSGWYVRAHLRALGLWSGVIDRDRLEVIRQTLIALVDGQAGYHRGASQLMARIDKRLLRIGDASFALTFLLGIVNLSLEFLGIELPFNWYYALIGINTALPAFGSATFGIRLIGDFEGAAQRSARSAATLEPMSAALSQDPPELAVLRSRAAALTDTMLGDIAHWRMATESRKLVAPV